MQGGHFRVRRCRYSPDALFQIASSPDCDGWVQGRPALDEFEQSLKTNAGIGVTISSSTPAVLLGILEQAKTLPVDSKPRLALTLDGTTVKIDVAYQACQPANKVYRTALKCSLNSNDPFGSCMTSISQFGRETCIEIDKPSLSASPHSFSLMNTIRVSKACSKIALSWTEPKSSTRTETFVLQYQAVLISGSF